MDAENVNVLCRICISSNSNSTQQMIPIFGEESLWQKITTLAEVKIEPDDTLPQQVCVACAKSAISACIFKQKCEDADKFFRQQLLLPKLESGEIITNISANAENKPEEDIKSSEEQKQQILEAKVENVEVEKSNSKEIIKEVEVEEHEATVKHVNKVKPTDDQANDADDDDDDDDSDSDDDSDDSDSSDSDDDSSSSSNDEDETELKIEQEQTEIPAVMESDDAEQRQRQLLAAGMSSLLAAGYGIADDGEIKCTNGIKAAPFDFNSIRLMHEYMQNIQQFSKMNANSAVNHALLNGSGNTASDQEQGENDAGAENMADDEGLPLIPEIELITPTESGSVGAITTFNADGVPTNMTPMRGYQCPSCFQIFEMKQILKAHMQSVHGTAGPVYECTNCKKTYFYKRFLEKHVRRGRCVKKRRNQTRPMQCSDCNVLFPTGHHLGWHKRTGCPSRASKLPLQQVFKQNVSQFNNIPKRIGMRKPENAIYLHNRKLMMASNKRKGRTRIKLDAKKIALAKQLIMREATTTVIANELNISRTFAWRLRKSLVNGVSLHERVIDQNSDDQEQQTLLQQQQQYILQQQLQQQQQQQQQQFPHIKMAHIKPEQTESTDDEDNHNNNNDGDDDDERGEGEEEECVKEKKKKMNVGELHGPLPLIMNNESSGIEKNSIGNDENIVDDKDNKSLKIKNETKMVENESSSSENLKRHSMYPAMHSTHPHPTKKQQEQFLQNIVAQAQRENVIVSNGAVDFHHKHSAKNSTVLPPLPPILGGFPASVAAAINQLPVNLSIRPIASMQKIDASSLKKLNNSMMSSTSPNTTPTPGGGTPTNQALVSIGGKKPRKPNVFIDDEKYAMAKVLVSQNASTMEIARALNVSQMTAWKVRDAIVKGLPLSYRNKRDRDLRPNLYVTNPTTTTTASAAAAAAAAAAVADLRRHHHQQQQQQHDDNISSGGSDNGSIISDKKLFMQQQQQQQQQQEELQRQKQQQQQQHLLQQQHLQLLQRQQQHLQQQLKQQEHHNTNSDSLQNGLGPKRRRLKAAEREMRDKEITREILELIKEDSNIQYWKVSARLSEKGYPISPSSVCQKLKSMGIHRRWKFGADKPKPLMDVEQLKVAAVAAAAAAQGMTLPNLGGVMGGAESVSSEAEDMLPTAAGVGFVEPQFHMGGAHFLSAFTR